MIPTELDTCVAFMQMRKNSLALAVANARVEMFSTGQNIFQGWFRISVMIP